MDQKKASNHKYSHFDLIAGEYETSLPFHIMDHYLQKRVIFIKNILPSGLVLDVGCGTGAIIQSLAKEGYVIFGIDSSQGMLKRLNDKRPGFQVRANAVQLPFPSAKFDLVLNIATLHHLAEPDIVKRAIHEMLRVIRRGGHLLIWDHNRLNPYWKLLMPRVPQDFGDERLIPYHEILGTLRAASGRVAFIKHYTLGFIPDFMPKKFMSIAGKLEAIAEKIPFIRHVSAHNVFLVRKA